MKGFAVLAAVSLAGFLAFFPGVAAAKKIDADALERIKRIGVVSVAGDTLISQKVGLTAFGNKHETFDVADWKLDEAWANSLAAATDKLEKFDVAALGDDAREALMPRIDGYAEFNKRTREAAKAVVESAEVDALIVFATQPEQFLTTNQYIDKYGLLRYSYALKKHESYYITGRLYLIDATGALLDTRYVDFKHSEYLLRYVRGSAPDELKGVGFGAYSDEQKEMVRRLLSDIPEEVWDAALAKLLETK